jgi:hypothetical protein
MQMVRGWYSERRFELFVTMARSVDNYRFGRLPVEVRAADWKIASYDANKGVGVVRGLTVGPGKSWAAKIYCDVRNRQRFALLTSGDAIPLALKIVRGTKEPFPGATTRSKAWFVRVSAMFPRSERQRSKSLRTLTLGHDPGSLLFGYLDDVSAGRPNQPDDETFEFHGDAVREMIVGGDRSDRRRQQDHSLTRPLMSRRKFRRWRLDRTRRCENRARKIDMQLRLAAAALVRWCQQRGVDDVIYDTSDRGFVPHFPYRRLRDYIGCGLEAAGVSLVTTGEAADAPESEATT